MGGPRLWRGSSCRTSSSSAPTRESFCLTATFQQGGKLSSFSLFSLKLTEFMHHPVLQNTLINTSGWWWLPCSHSPSLLPLQAPNPCYSQQEYDDACVVSWRDERDSPTLDFIVSLETTIGAHIANDNTAIVSIDVFKHWPLHLSRFDLTGLSPDSPEDEPGIKKAAENSEFNVFTYYRSGISVGSTLVHRAGMHSYI